MKKIIIFGINDLAELAWFYMDNLEAFTVNKEYLTQNEFHELPVVPFEELEQHYPPSDYYLFAPVTDNKLREKIYNEGIKKGYEFTSYISPNCTNYASSIVISKQGCEVVDKSELFNYINKHKNNEFKRK